MTGVRGGGVTHLGASCGGEDFLYCNLDGLSMVSSTPSNLRLGDDGDALVVIFDLSLPVNLILI